MAGARKAKGKPFPFPFAFLAPSTQANKFTKAVVRILKIRAFGCDLFRFWAIVQWSWKPDILSELGKGLSQVKDWLKIGDRFREHLRDVEKDDKDASKPVARHFNLPNHSKKHMAICGLSLHLGTTESRKNLEQKFIFQIGTLNPHGINAFHLTNIFLFFTLPCYHQ